MARWQAAAPPAEPHGQTLDMRAGIPPAPFDLSGSLLLRQANASRAEQRDGSSSAR